ncbi:MAG: hypothetical protein CM1200mP40_01820 [Gammaproteobacteria bacterium]|nr:MAG: hypothetical protein CM1200mP40_01820 [Gammaproteobacteria bacterium]
MITAEGVINNESNATVLYLSGLDGNESKNNNLDELVPPYAEVAGPNDINLIVISRANPEGNQLQFPPEGKLIRKILFLMCYGVGLDPTHQI